MIVPINNIFAIGFRCNTDDFIINFLKIRKYSSPFSYAVIDIKSAIYFINSNFETYVDNDYILEGSDTIRFNKHKWRCNNIHKITNLPSKTADILFDVERVCLWSHHDLNDTNVKKSFIRRSNHLADCIKNKPSTTLLFYIERIQKNKDSYHFDINILNTINSNFLILIPFEEMTADPYIFYTDNKINIIYFKSSLDQFSTEIHRDIDIWNKLKTLILSIYTFNIEDRYKENLLPV